MADVNGAAVPLQPPTDPNSVGTNVNILASVMMVLMTIIVGMRIWGRYRYRGLANKGGLLYGQSKFWIFLSDLTIIIAWVNAVAEA